MRSEERRCNVFAFLSASCWPLGRGFYSRIEPDFHLLVQLVWLPRRLSARSRSKIVGLYRGRAQPLHGVAAFLDRLSRPIDSAVEFLLALLRAF